MKVVLETERLRLALPGPGAAALLVRHFVDNKEHRGRWDPPRPRGFYTERWWRERLAQARVEYERRSSMKLVLLRARAAGEPALTEDSVVGTCNFTQFTRRACRLGYGLDRRCEGKGFMSEALRAAIPHVFERFRTLEAVVATYRPENERSGRLLERLGFIRDGKEARLVEGHRYDELRVRLPRESVGKVGPTRSPRAS